MNTHRIKFVKKDFFVNFFIGALEEKYMEVARSTKGALLYKCTLCGKVVDHKGNLRRHIICKHTSSQAECPYCHRTYKTTISLQSHLRNCANKKSVMQELEEEKSVFD